MRKQLAAGLASLAAVVAVAHTASAISPQPVSVVVARALPARSVATASTACAGGTTTDAYVHAGPSPDKWPSGSDAAQLRVGKVFHCTGGDFSVNLTVTLDLTNDTTAGTWVITSGTGDYEHLRGHGTVVGVPVPGGIEDSYSGVVTGL